MLRFLPLLFLLTACGLPSHFQASKAYKGAKTPYEGKVQVLEAFPAHYEKIGRVSSGGYLITSEESMIEALTAEAAAHGANAVVIENEMENSGFSSFSVTGSYSAPKRLEGIAIKMPVQP